MFAICWTIGITLFVVGIVWCLVLWSSKGADPYGITMACAFPGVVLAIVGLAEILLTSAARLIYWWSTGG